MITLITSTTLLVPTTLLLLGLALNHEEDYAVEKVVDMRTCEVMGVQYLIRWVGYQSEDDTWVNEANVDALEAVAQYLSLAC